MSVRGFVLRLTENFSRYKLLFFVPALITGFLGYFFTQGVEQYKSEGVVLVDSDTFLSSLTEVRNEGFSWRSPSDIANEQLSALLNTDDFVQAIVDEAGVEDRIRPPLIGNEDFYPMVRASIAPSYGGENFMLVSAWSADPEVAQLLADATIETYVVWQIDADLKETRLAEDFVDGLVADYDEEVQRAQGELTDWIRSNPGPLRIEDRPVDEQLEMQTLQNNISDAGSRYTSAISKREDARLATAQAEADIRQSFIVIDPPSIPLSPENSVFDVLVTIAALAFIGLLMSATVLAVLSASDSSLRFPSEVEELLGADLLAVVPKVVQP